MNVFYLMIISFKTLKADSYYMLVQNIDATGISESFNYTDLIIYFALGLSVLINIFLLVVKKKNRRYKSTPSESRGNYDDYNRSIDRRVKQLEDENKKLKDEKKRLEDKLSSYENNRVSNYEEKRDSAIENRIQPKASSPLVEQHYEDEKPKTFDLKINKPNAIYLPSPFENNRFSIEDVSNEQMPTSLYQILLDASNTTGKLLIIENADFTRALNSPDHYLEKACIYENAFSPNANEINIVEPGKVKLENQDWLITQKIKIKFI